MKRFIICAHIFPTYGNRTHFVRILYGKDKNQAIKNFFSHFGYKNAIDKVVELTKNEENKGE